MKREKSRDLALKTLNRITENSQYSGEYLNDLFRCHPYMDNRDRAFISQLIQGVVRWKLRLDWIIGQFSIVPPEKIELHVLNILRLSLYQILFLERIPDSAAVNEAVNQVKGIKNAPHLISFVNAILRNICRRRNEIRFPHRTDERLDYLSVYHSYPDWLLKKWINELGDESTEKLITVQNRFPGLIIRTNTLKLSRNELLKHLSIEGIKAIPLSYAPQGIYLTNFRGRIDASPSFKKGLFQVQYEAAQIVSHILNPKPKESILDICAGFGGKSTHLAEITSGEGDISALDINRNRLVSLLNNTRRLGIVNVKPLVADASRSLSAIFRCKFDKIMVDSPCSGLGVISRHPDVKWNRNQDDIKRLARLQNTILKNAASVLKEGGRMLYVTCTISKEENEDVVKEFLVRNECMSLENLNYHMPEWGRDLVSEEGFFRTLPHVHKMDGFFAALFSKR